MARSETLPLIGYSRLAALLASCFLTTGASAQVIFEDDFDDNAAGWTEESLTGNFGIAGSDVVFGFDYSADGVPEAPNSAPGDTGTSGVRLRTNTGGLANDQNAIWIEDADFSGKYTVQVDMWLNWPPAPGALGTTIFGGLYVGDAFEGDVSTNDPIQRGAGFYASSDGDCGNCDYVLAKNQHELDLYSDQYSVRDFGFGNQGGIDNTDFNTDPAEGDLINLPGFLPTFSIDDATGGEQNAGEDQPAGAAGFQWVTLTAEVDPTATGLGPAPGQTPTGVTGVTTFSITNPASGQTIEIGKVDNSRPDILDDDGDGDECDTSEGSEDICGNLNAPLDGDVPVDMEGRLSLVVIDFFAGAASNTDLSYALFDNLVVSASDDPGLAADFNGDGTVDLLDLDILGQNFGGPGDMSMGDANGDGTIDLLDLDILGQQFGMSGSTAVPEPTTALLAGLALGLLPRRRR